MPKTGWLQSYVAGEVLQAHFYRRVSWGSLDEFMGDAYESLCGLGMTVYRQEEDLLPEPPLPVCRICFNDWKKRKVRDAVRRSQIPEIGEAG